MKTVLQKIQEKRGAYERERRRKFLIKKRNGYSILTIKKPIPVRLRENILPQTAALEKIRKQTEIQAGSSLTWLHKLKKFVYSLFRRIV